MCFISPVMRHSRIYHRRKCSYSLEAVQCLRMGFPGYEKYFDVVLAHAKKVKSYEVLYNFKKYGDMPYKYECLLTGYLVGKVTKKVLLTFIETVVKKDTKKTYRPTEWIGWGLLHSSIVEKRDKSTFRVMLQYYVEFPECKMMWPPYSIVHDSNYTSQMRKMVYEAFPEEYYPISRFKKCDANWLDINRVHAPWYSRKSLRNEAIEYLKKHKKYNVVETCLDCLVPSHCDLYAFKRNFKRLLLEQKKNPAILEEDVRRVLNKFREFYPRVKLRGVDGEIYDVTTKERRRIGGGEE